MCPCKDTRKIIQHFSYSLDNSIGKGFSSVVYRGVNDKTGGTVAIKVINLHQLKQSVLQSLLNAQIDILQSLNHKNILKCEGVFITVNNCYIMTEYCDCGDLASLLSRKRRLEEYETIFMMKEICEGYQYLRSKGIIHRDIKPANILINQGIPRIGDFGFAKLDSVVQKEKFRIGSPLYMSPKALNQAQYNQKNDIWALGVMFYEIVEGRPPWKVNSQAELKEVLALRNEIRFRYSIHPKLEIIIKGCLTYNEEDRMTIQEIMKLLKEVTPERPITRLRSSSQMSRQSIIRIHGDSREPKDGKQKSKPREFKEINKPKLGQCKQLKQQTAANKQNVATRDVNMSVSPLQQNLKTNYKIFKWIINYCRFVSKLFTRIDSDLVCLEIHKKAINQFLGDILYTLISKMQQREQLSSWMSRIGIKNYEHFKLTQWFGKIDIVTKEYHERYLKQINTICPGRQLRLDGNQITPSAGLLEALALITVDENFNQHSIAFDMLLSLVVTNLMIDSTGILALCDLIDFEAIIETTPAKLDGDALQQLRAKQTSLIGHYSEQPQLSQ